MVSDKRLNREKSLLHDKFNVKYGVTNRLSPTVVYVIGKTFLMPISNDVFSLDIIRREFKKSILRLIDKKSYLKKKFIFNFEIHESGVKKGKYSIATFEMYFSQEKNMPLKDIKAIGVYIKDGVIDVLNNLQNEIQNNGFDILRNKSILKYD